MYEALISTLRAEAEDDYIGLWELVDDIKLLDPDQQPDVVKMRTLDLVSEMIAGGFIAVDLAADGGYEPWRDQDPEKILPQIDAAWQQLGREPNIGDIVWFAIP